MTKLYKPTLYRTQESGPPVLIGRQCQCGHVYFPPQDYGCEKCGATGSALQEKILQGQGKLVSWATVHMHAKPYPKAPFVVGKIALSEGPVMRALLKVPDEQGLQSGMAVKATMVPVDEAQEVLDLWFEPATE